MARAVPDVAARLASLCKLQEARGPWEASLLQYKRDDDRIAAWCAPDSSFPAMFEAWLPLAREAADTSSALMAAFREAAPAPAADAFSAAVIAAVAKLDDEVARAKVVFVDKRAEKKKQKALDAEKARLAAEWAEMKGPSASEKSAPTGLKTGGGHGRRRAAYTLAAPPHPATEEKGAKGKQPKADDAAKAEPGAAGAPAPLKKIRAKKGKVDPTHGALTPTVESPRPTAA
jgi:hypothetical protein